MATQSYSKLNTGYYSPTEVGRQLDKYAKFYWRGEDMWNTYHVFIENEKRGALKFNNGPSFANSYSSPQFDHAAGNLVGVKFNRCTVSFKICIYAVTMATYRAFMKAIGPYEIDYLAFAYDNKYQYLAKITGRKDSDKYVIGCDANGEDLYMSEMTLTFEVQGEQVALAQNKYIWSYNVSGSYEDDDFAIVGQSSSIGSSSFTYNYNFTFTQPYCLNDNYKTVALDSETALSLDYPAYSDEDFPITAEFGVVLPYNRRTTLEGGLKYYVLATDEVDATNCLTYYTRSVVNNEFTYTLASAYDENTEYYRLCTYSLFQISLNAVTANWMTTLVANADGEATYTIPIDRTFHFRYNSNTGLIYLQYGSEDYRLLNLSTLTDSGKPLVFSMFTTKFRMPGGTAAESVSRLNSILPCNYDFVLSLTTMDTSSDDGNVAALHGYQVDSSTNRAEGQVSGRASTMIL